MAKVDANVRKGLTGMESGARLMDVLVVKFGMEQLVNVKIIITLLAPSA